MKLLSQKQACQRCMKFCHSLNKINPYRTTLLSSLLLRITHQMVLHPTGFYTSIESYRTGKRWTLALIKKMWGIAWDLWEHRNGILHETQNVISSAALHQLHRNISDTFGNLQLLALPLNDRHLISTPLSRLLKTDRI